MERWQKVYHYGLLLAAPALAALVWLTGPDRLGAGSVWIALAILLPLHWYLDRRAFQWTTGSLSLGCILLLASLLIWGPQAAYLLTLTWLLMPISWERRLFNLAMYLVTLSAAWLWSRHLDLADLSARSLLLLGGALLTFWFTNIAVVAVRSQLKGAMPLRAFLVNGVLPVTEEYFFNMMLAVLGVVAYEHLGWAGAVLAGTMMAARLRSVEKTVQLRNQNELSIRSLIAAIEARDSYTSGHSDRAASLARQFAEYLNLPPGQVTRVWNAGRLHDVGKIGIPDGILTKEGYLTDEEYRLVQTHAIVGERILATHDHWRDLAEIVGQHHEWHNGQGYPRGLSGTSIRLEAQIIAVVDAFDAMISNRSYRPAREPAAALGEIRRGAGTQFDPFVADQFVAMMSRELGVEPASEQFGA